LRRTVFFDAPRIYRCKYLSDWNCDLIAVSLKDVHSSADQFLSSASLLFVQSVKIFTEVNVNVTASPRIICIVHRFIEHSTFSYAPLTSCISK